MSEIKNYYYYYYYRGVDRYSTPFQNSGRGVATAPTPPPLFGAPELVD